MTKEQRIQDLDWHINKLEADLDNLKQKKQILLNSTEITFEQLVKEYVKDKSTIITKEIVQDQSFKVVLGGDGRSTPYDKMDIGTCLNVYYSEKFYIDLPEKQKFIKFLKIMAPNNVSCIFLNEEKL